MLMNEQQVRLNEVRLKVREAMDFMRYLKENHPEHALAPGLDHHIDAYREMLDELTREVKQVGALPRDPDPEFEIVEQMMAEVKSLFGEDRATVLTQEFNKYRLDLIDTIQYALEVDYPENIKLSLQKISRYTRESTPHLPLKGSQGT